MEHHDLLSADPPACAAPRSRAGDLRAMDDRRAGPPRLPPLPGTLYPMLHKMERDGYLVSRQEREGRTVRKLYTITPKGKRRLGAGRPHPGVHRGGDAQMTDSTNTLQHEAAARAAHPSKSSAPSLGLTSFGGPIAHLGYFRSEFVERRRWLDDRSYPIWSPCASSCRGRPAARSVWRWLGRAGWLGLLAAWAGFTLPSAIALILFAFGIAEYQGWPSPAGCTGSVVAVAIVAQAVWGWPSRCARTGRAPRWPFWRRC